MLVLTRKVGERIMIGKDIIIEVVDRKADKVRIGISAPPDVKILREELLLNPGVFENDLIEGEPLE